MNETRQIHVKMFLIFFIFANIVKSGLGSNLTGLLIHYNTTLLYGQVKLDSVLNPQSIDKVSSMKSQTSFKGVGYDQKRKTFYVAETSMKIYMLDLERNSKQPLQIIMGRSEITAIAFDWITSNLYLLDNLSCRILVCHINSTMCAIVVQNLSKCSDYWTTDLVVEPISGIMFWGISKESAIWKAGMDGSNPEIIVSERIERPTTITIEYQQKRLYWVDSELKRIESCFLNGSDRKTLRLQPGSAFPEFFDVLSEKIFYLTTQFDSILEVANISDNVVKNGYPLFWNQAITTPEIDGGIVGFRITDLEKQPERPSNPCFNVNCSHLCALNPGPLSEYKCLCPPNMELTKDTYTCKNIAYVPGIYGPIKLLITSPSSTTFDLDDFEREFRPNEDDREDKGYRFTFRGHRKRITYDARSNVAFVITKNGQVFKKPMYQSGIPSLVADIGLQEPISIAFDWIVGNMYILDAIVGNIIVCSSASNLCSKVLQTNVGLHEDITLDLANGLMYWTMSTFTSVDTVKGAIWKAGMDGSNPQPFILNDLQEPAGVALNFQSGRLLWFDTKKYVIESCLLDGRDRRIIVNTNEFSDTNFKFLSVFRNNVYLKDISSNDYWVLDSEPSGFPNPEINHRPLGSSKIKKTRDIVFVEEDNQPQARTNPCSSSNCSHLCVISPDGDKPYRCLCPYGVALNINDNTCPDTAEVPQLVIAFENVLQFTKIGIIGNDVFEKIVLPNSTSIDDIVFNPVANALIFSDKNSMKILQLQLNNQVLTEIIRDDLVEVLSIDIDIIAQNVYWIDSGKETIEMVSLKTRGRMVLKYNFTNLNDIIVVSEFGKLFVSQYEDHIGFVWEMSLDGKHKKLFTSHPEITIKLFYNREHNNILWLARSGSGNSREGVIFATALDEPQSQIIARLMSDGPRTVPDVVDFVYVDKKIYFSAKSSNVVPFVEASGRPEFTYGLLNEAKIRAFILQKIRVLDHTTSFKLTIVHKNISNIAHLLHNHECSAASYQRKFCSHICIPGNETYNGQCYCSEDMVLQNDGMTCLDCSREKTHSLCTMNATVSNGNESSSDLFRSNLIVTIGIVGVAMTVLFLSVFLFLRWRLRKQRQIISDLEISEFRNGIEHGNSNQYKDSHIFGLNYDHEKFEIGKHEFVRESSTKIGGGNFGLVYKSYMPRFMCEVAVKMPKSGNVEELRSILCEIKILSYVGEHPNVVKLLGAYTKEIGTGIVLIVSELCKNGSLLNHLKTIRTKKPTKDDMHNLFRYCAEIARGMEYLAKKYVIHGDLSARNILLDENSVCKICDFGLSRKVERYATYIKQTQEPLPWAWLPLESLTKLEFTTKSYVWSMGITFWEIFTFGDRPYPGETCCEEFLEKIKNGFRLPKPEMVSTEVFEMILRCWHLEPNIRPHASTLNQFFMQQSK